MTLRNRNLATIQQGFNPLGIRNKIRGSSLATQASRDAALYTQMRAAPHGRRVVCHVGIDGQQKLLVLDGTSPSSGGTQIYPLGNAERVMARQVIRLTPGYYLRGLAIMLPTGPGQQFVAVDGTWQEDQSKPVAGVRVDVTYTGSLGSSSVSRTLKPKVSTETNKGLPAGAGAAWGVLEVHEGNLIAPEMIVGGTPGWTERVTASIVITAVGPCRPVDISVYEVPGWASHDDDHRECTSSGMDEHIQPSIEYALTGLDPPDDDRWGAHQADKTTNDQRQVWGPALFQWSSWNDTTATVTGTEAAAKSFTSTSFRDLATNLTAYGTTQPGWSVSSGGYARNLEQSGLLELRDVNGCIPVTVRVYARMLTAAHVGTVRFQAADYSYREITVTGSTSFAWYTGVWWMRCPVHASLDSHIQVLCKVAGVQTLEVRYCSVEYGGHFTPTE